MEKKPKIKIAHVVTLLEFGGAQQNTLYTLEHMDRDRFSPFLLSGRGAYLDGEIEKSDFPTFFINSLARPVHPVRDLLALWEIYFVLKREKPDIVHTHSSKAGILARWAAKLAGVPVILHTYHGFGFNREQKFWTRFIFVLLERLTARLSTALILVSKNNQSEALSRGIGRPAQYRLIRSGIPLALYRSLTRRPNAPDGIPLSPEHKLITSVGPFKPQKNLTDFVQAAEKVHAKRPEARFMIVGDGALRETLEKEIRRRNLGEVFFLPGWRRDIPHIYMRTSVFVLTSLWEGLPRALAEAMSSGLPCVANAIDGVNDIITDGINGFLVAPKRPDLTAERLIYLLENPNFALQMGELARESIGEEFDIEHMVRQQEDLYVQLNAAKG